MDSEVISSEEYRNETAQLKKRLEHVKFERSAFRRHLSTRNISVCSLNETSMWSPCTDMSAQLSDSQYSMSTCSHHDESSLCHCNHNEDSPAQISTTATIQRECLSECVRELMFGDITELSEADMSFRSGDSSFSLDSGYTSLPDPDSISTGSSSNSSSNSATTLDSDATAFVEAPLPLHRPVTHKTTNQRIIAKQLKRVSKQIHKHGIDNCMSTLAVL